MTINEALGEPADAIMAFPGISIFTLGTWLVGAMHMRFPSSLVTHFTVIAFS